MNNIFILITTYNRPYQLLNLLKQINEQRGKYNIELLVVNDCSDVNYTKPVNFLQENFKGSVFYSTDRNYGKKHYYSLVGSAYEFALESKWDYFIQLPDDVSLIDNFFDISIRLFNIIPREKRAAINLITDIARFGRPCFNKIEPETKEFEGYTFYETGWMDMCFMCNDKLFGLLNHKIEPVHTGWSGNPKLSSGVGKQISNRITEQGYRFYQYSTSLVIHQHGESRMHPILRKKIPLISKMDKITASLASFPPREMALKGTVESILPQVDELHVYLNNYVQTPKYLEHPKIRVYKSQLCDDDLGDAGKFYTAEFIKGYHFTIDDDLIYPFYYVQNMIDAIEKHGRKKAITLHGRIFNQLPVKSYYKGHSFAYGCLNEVKKDTLVHVGGTGVMAYHTDTIRFNLELFEMTNMADIWFAKHCHENNVRILLLAHEKGYIKNSPYYRLNETIYANCHQNDEVQTNIINSIKWIKIYQ